MPKPSHNKSRTKEYRAWVRMLHRCHNVDYPGYHNYGGRGIRVCARWRASFTDFLADMGRAPTADHSIEREQNHLGYFPGNCTWATKVEQANNRRTNVTWTYNGLTKTMTEWARFLGRTRKCLWKRRSLGWPIEDILSPWPSIEEQKQRAAA